MAKKKVVASLVNELRGFKGKDFVTCSRADLLEAMLLWKNATALGGTRKYIMSLIADIITLRSIDPFTDTELNPNTTLDWEIVTYDHLADSYIPRPGGYDCDYMGAFSVHGVRKLLFLYWLGMRPDPEKVAKKVREMGAHTLFM